MSYLPKAYHNVTPYLIIADASAAVEFYKSVFGAEELTRLCGPDGKIGHCEIKIGDSTIMLADEFPQMGARGPKSFGGSPISIMLYVENVDAVFAKCLAAGAEQLRPIEDKFYGDRSGSLVDPFGHQWHLSTHVKDVSPEEMEKAAAALANEHSTEKAEATK